MPTLRTQLDLPRCPLCSVDRPTLASVAQHASKDYTESNQRVWRMYQCLRCGGVVTAAARNWDGEIIECYPAGTELDEAIPDKAHNYLSQALNSLSAPSGAVMLAASAVDAMLKAKDLKKGTLYQRIDKAAAEHLITAEMAQWAHDVRLDANDERHADETAPLPTSEDAKRAVDFSMALAQFMFVLPARVRHGIAAAGGRSG